MLYQFKGTGRGVFQGWEQGYDFPLQYANRCCVMTLWKLMYEKEPFPALFVLPGRRGDGHFGDVPDRHLSDS